MTLFISEEHGRILTDKSIKKLMKEYFAREKVNKATVVSLTADSNQTFHERIRGTEMSEWELIYIADGHKPYMLGSDQKQKLYSLMEEGTDLSANLKRVL